MNIFQVIISIEKALQQPQAPSASVLAQTVAPSSASAVGGGGASGEEKTGSGSGGPAAASAETESMHAALEEAINAAEAAVVTSVTAKQVI